MRFLSSTNQIRKRTSARVIFSAGKIRAASSIPRERRNSRNVNTMNFVISALFIFSFCLIYSTFCRSFTVLILNNLFFNLELLEMFLRQGFGQSKSQFLGTYQHHQSTVETSQSFHSKPVSQIFGSYIFIQIYHIFVTIYTLNMSFFHLLFGTFVWLPFFANLKWLDVQQKGSHLVFSARMCWQMEMAWLIPLLNSIPKLKNVSPARFPS